MPYILGLAFFIICIVAQYIRNKIAPVNVLEPAPSNANAGVETATGEIIFGEHWQAWADAINREAAEPWEEQAA